MKNYKYSFLALVFAISAISYSHAAYEYCPEGQDQEVCTESCKKARKPSKRNEVEETKSTITMSRLVKAGIGLVGYWLWLEHVPDRVGNRYGESAKEIIKVVPAVFFIDPIKDVLRKCEEVFDGVIDTSIRAIY
jgi:hypothetical protein